jgi:NTP pyrophosphatase (non-canonical NTP hydrolase)
MGKYKIYHIKGKKIGCTKNTSKRLGEQGYADGEYDVLFQTDDIKEASKVEKQLQEALGYKVDRKPYNEVINKSKRKIKTTSSDATTTFYKDPQSLEAAELVGLEIMGITLNKDHATWIIANLKNSQFNKDTCYIYNKAFKNYDLNNTEVFVEQSNDFYSRVRNWATLRDLYKEGDVKTQFAKLVEEVGELAKGVVDDNDALIKDSIGDIVVVLVNLAYLQGTSIEICQELAWDDIKDRKGKMLNGTFVKEVL